MQSLQCKNRVLFLVMLALCDSGRVEALFKESLWVRQTSLDGLTTPTGVLWVQEGSVSGAECAATCLDSKECDAVFYNPRTRQCQGQSGTVRVLGTASKPDNVLYSRVTTPAPSTPPVHFESQDGSMIYDVYVSGPKTWYDAEATCDSLGQRLIRLDTSEKVNSLITVLGLYPTTAGKDIYVAGIICCKQRTVYWRSGQRDVWKEYTAAEPIVSDLVYKVNSGDMAAGLQLHPTPTDKNLFVCETVV